MPHNEQAIEDYHEGDALEIISQVTYEDGTVVDLTGASAEWVLKEDIRDTQPVLEKTDEQGGTEEQIEFHDPENGFLRVIIETGDTEGVIDWENGIGTEREFYHRLRVTDAEGRRVTGYHGNFMIHL